MLNGNVLFLVRPVPHLRPYNPVGARRHIPVGDDITGILSTVVGFIKQGEDDNPQLEALTKEIEALAASGEDPTPERLNALVKDISARSDRIQEVDLSGGETEET